MIALYKSNSNAWDFKQIKLQPWQLFPKLEIKPRDRENNLELIGRDVYMVTPSSKHALSNRVLDVLRGWITNQPKKLEGFEKLPYEIQNQIFELALPGPRTIITTVITTDGTPDNLEYGLMVHPIATPLLHVNSRARAIALKRYTAYQRVETDKPVYISWEYDNLHFEYVVKLAAFLGAWPGSPPPPLSNCIRNCIENIQHLVRIAPDLPCLTQMLLTYNQSRPSKTPISPTLKNTVRSASKLQICRH